MTTTRGRTGFGQLMLFVALLFGVVAMHTLGHPSGHASGHAMEQPAGHGPAAHAAPMSVPMRAMHASPSSPSSSVAEPVRVVVDRHPSPGDGGMDPLSVCLAVLGSFTLLLLLTAVVLRPSAAASVRTALRGLAYALRPNPPPPRTLLSRLSVLRI